MPAGCDFVCENEKCTEHRKGVVIINKWPLGDIEKVVEARAVKKNEAFRRELIALKGTGRTYACITYPNVDNIPISGYRVQKWCQGCFCIWGWDIMLGEEVADTKEASEKFLVALAKETIPLQCPKCSGVDLFDFQKVVEVGIVCPHCKEKMKTYTWFSNEKE